MRRTWLVVGVALLLILAGCTGIDGDDPGDDMPDANETDVPAEESDDSDGDTGATDDGDDEATDEGADTPPEDDGDGNDTVAVDGEFELHHLDVGQADATLLVTPDGETILIDTGDWPQDGAEVISYLESEGIDRIDHLVATHAHADHIGGHAAVIEHFETEKDGIGNIYDSGISHDTATFENYLDAVDEHGHELLIVEEGDELPIEDDAVEALVVNPEEGDSGTDLHYNSVSLVIEFGDFQYLTTGDAETAAEERMADEWGDELDADVYHAGHHGSYTSSTATFLDAATPDITIISSGYESQFGHPHDEVLERFASNGIETYWTGVHGDIVVTTDGDEVTVETTDEFSTDPDDILDEKPTDNDDESYSIAPVTQHSQLPVAG